MKMILGALALLIAAALAPVGAQAQSSIVHVTCAPSSPYANNQTGRPFTIDENGNTCITGSISASLTGFTPGGTYATLTASGSSGSVALPAGATVAVSNSGTTTVSCTLGIGSATAVPGQIQVPASSTIFVTPGSNTFIGCIDETGSASNVVRLAGGSGLGTGFGGGGGGSGGGGAITAASGSYASGALSSGSIASGAMAAGSHAAGSGVDGWDLTQGAIADAAVTAGATGSVSAKLRSISRDVMTVNTWAGGTLGAMANYGTSPGAVLVPGVNAFITNTPSVVQSGTWTVQPGNTANTTPWLVTVNNTLTAVTPGDGITTTIYGTAPASPVIGVPLLWNGTTYDRWKSAGATGVAAVRPTDGTRNAIVDPCEATLQSYAPISITTATTTRIVAPSASNKTYICSLFLTSAAADNVGIVEGTGGTCGTGTAGVVGGTTAANGPNFAANGGMLLQAGGKVAAAQTAGTNVDLCLITSAATPLAGGIKYVQAP